MDEDQKFPHYGTQAKWMHKFDEIILIQVLGFVEDERTFNNLTYMKTSYEVV